MEGGKYQEANKKTKQQLRSKWELQDHRVQLIRDLRTGTCLGRQQDGGTPELRQEEGVHVLSWTEGRSSRPPRTGLPRKLLRSQRQVRSRRCHRTSLPNCDNQKMSLDIADHPVGVDQVQNCS